MTPQRYTKGGLRYTAPHLSKLKSHVSTGYIKKSKKVTLQARTATRWCDALLQAGLENNILSCYINVITLTPGIAKTFFCWVFWGGKSSLRSYLYILWGNILCSGTQLCVSRKPWHHHWCLAPFAYLGRNRQLAYCLVSNSSTWEQGLWNIPTCTGHRISCKHLWLNSQQPQPTWTNSHQTEI